MGKKYKIFSRIIFITLLLFLGFKSVSAVYHSVFSDREKIVTLLGSGIVTDKFESDYSCGSKGKYTCYSRYLILDHSKKIEVNDNTFKESRIGDNVKLTITENKEATVLHALLLIIGVFYIGSTFLVLCVFIYSFIHWSLFYSDKRTFMDHLF